MEPFLIVALSSTAVAGADANPLRDQTDGKYASRVLLGRRRALWLWVRACINACPQRFCSCLHFQPCLDIPALFTSHDGAMVMSVRGATLTFRGAESCPPCKQCPEPEACPIQEPCPEPEPIHHLLLRRERALPSCHLQCFQGKQRHRRPRLPPKPLWPLAEASSRSTAATTSHIGASLDGAMKV